MHPYLVVHADPEFAWNGFLTLGLSAIDDDEVTTQGNVPYSTHTESIDEQADTKFALQGSATFTPGFSATVQLLSKANNDYKVDVEWAYFSLQATENLKLRLGQLRRPLFRYSDYYDVGYAYSWVRPPTTTYFEFGPFYNPIDSIDFYYQKSFGEWSLSGQTYYGQDSGRGELFFQTLTYEERHAYGTAWEVEKDSTSFRVGYHHSRFSLDIPVINQAAEALNQFGFSELAEPISIQDKLAEFISIGGAITKKSWTVSAETTRMTPKDSILPTINAWYASLEKNFGTYSVYYSYGEQSAKNAKDVTSPIYATSQQLAQVQDPSSQFAAATLEGIGNGLSQSLDSNESDRRTNTLGVRHEVHRSAALKFEYERVKNTDTRSIGNIFSINIDLVF